MITDKSLTFGFAEATGDTGTNNIGDVINLEDLRDVGAGKQMFLNVVVDADITAAGTSTYTVRLVSSAAADLSTPNVHAISATLDPEATIDAGTVILNMALPAEGEAYLQYIGIQEIVVTGNTTAGALNAFLTIDQRSYKAYPDGAVT